MEIHRFLSLAKQPAIAARSYPKVSLSILFLSFVLGTAVGGGSYFATHSFTISVATGSGSALFSIITSTGCLTICTRRKTAPLNSAESSSSERSDHKEYSVPIESGGSSSTQNSLVDTEEEVQYVCPITHEPFTNPWILLEDGFTYEKEAIEKWLKLHPNTSPMIRYIPSATLHPNCAISKKSFECPITREPFKEPYYCVEDGHTYEKEAIITWFNTKVIEGINEGYDSITVNSPASAIELNSLTLYPNKILFKESKIPENQKPTIIKIDLNQITLNLEKQEHKCIFDDKIRELIKNYTAISDLEERKQLKKQIHQRRVELGLNVKKTFWGSLDLSHLNLSKMNLVNLQLKGVLLKDTDLSDTSLYNCYLSRCRFLNCNLQRTVFENCDFTGEEVSFFKSDMKDAVIKGHCRLEKGNTWAACTTVDELKTELSQRGALNAQSVTYIS